jgi:hypothetical protein
VTPPRFVIRQRETSGGYGFKPVPDSSRAPADSEMAYPINAVGAVWALVEAKRAVDAAAVGAV